MNINTSSTIPPPVECWGQAKEALEVFRRRVNELKKEARRKPDMIAFSELKKDWTPERKHGELPGVPIGLAVEGRGEAAILGIHTQILRGIDAVKGKACYAVCVSGGYVDDDDHSERHTTGTIYYTGVGGQDKRGDKRGRHVEDQRYSSVGNEALLKSMHDGTTIRVLRGQSPLYHYLGLYRCTGYVYEAGIHGKKVFKFTLVPVIENQCPAARALPLDTKIHRPVKTMASPDPEEPRIPEESVHLAAPEEPRIKGEPEPLVPETVASSVKIEPPAEPTLIPETVAASIKAEMPAIKAESESPAFHIPRKSTSIKAESATFHIPRKSHAAVPDSHSSSLTAILAAKMEQVVKKEKRRSLVIHKAKPPLSKYKTAKGRLNYLLKKKR